MKKKTNFITRFFALLLVFVILISSVMVTNAQEIDGNQYIDGFKVAANFNVNRDGTIYAGGSITTTDLDNGLRLRLNYVPDSDLNGLQVGDGVTVKITLTPQDDWMLDPSNNVTGTFTFGMKADSTTMREYNIFRETSGGTKEYATKSLSSAWGDYWKCEFNERSIGKSYNVYYIWFYYEVDTDLTTYARYVYLQDFDFTIQTADELASQDIIDNENKNHDELINGGPDYNAMDDSAVNDYTAADEALNSSISDYQSDSISFFNNFGNLFGSSHVSNGLLAVSAITKEFFAVDWVSDILTFALALGCFGFILGTVNLVARYNASSERRKEISEYRKERTEYYRSRKGGSS